MCGENYSEEDPGRLNKEQNEERDKTRKAKLQGRNVATKIENVGYGISSEK